MTVKYLSRKEALEILNGMKVKIKIPKAAVMQNKRNAALDMAIEALKYSEIPNSSTDCISRQAAIDALGEGAMVNYQASGHGNGSIKAIDVIKGLPSAQLDGIPLEWIDKHLEWLDNCDNDFAQLAKVSIKAMVGLWKKDRI